MRKIFITFLTSLCFFMNYSNAQLTVTMSSVEVDPNTQASVDITVNGFTNIPGAQFSINFDSTVLSYINTTNFSPDLPGLSASSVSGPNGVGVKNGQITFAWFDQQGTGKSLANGARLFTLVFNAIGPKCSKSDVITSNVPRLIEVVNSSFGNVQLINNKGVVTVKCDGTPVDPCPNPTCSNPNSLILSGAVINSEKDKTVCIPITVKNFKIMQSGQGSIKWDPSILQFTEVKTPATGGISGFSGGFNTNNAASGEFKYLWANDNPAVPLTLADNTVILELCFKVIGNNGQTGCILIGQGTLPTEWENNVGAVPVCFNYGKVVIGNTPPPGSVLIKTSSATGGKSTTVCLDVTVDNFTDVFGANAKWKWNTAQLKFLRTEMWDLEGLNQSAFSLSNDMSELSFLWTNPDGITKPNAHRIFKICFELLNPCDQTVSVNITGTPEIIGKVNGLPANVPVTATGGSITITCTDPVIKCELVNIISPNCNGQTSGSVLMSVTNATADCVCQWKNAAGAIVKTGLVSAGCNLTGVAAGTYNFEVLCSGVSKCTSMAVVTQPTAISIPTANVVTNANCNDKGAINIGATSGGNGGYTFLWTPDQGNTSNPTGLNAGTYTVLVTDSKGCTATANFNVANTPSNISIPTVNVVTNIGCGQKGAIDIRGTTGGNGTLTYAWIPDQGNTANPTNLNIGTYAVTVTDTKGCTAAASFTVTNAQPNLTVTSVVTSVKCKDGSDGSILINISGGCSPFTYAWTGNLSGANPQNLKAGTYTVTVTDSETPTQSRTLTITVTEPASALAIALTGTTEASTASAEDGKITLNITGGTPTYKTVWSGPTTVPDGTTSGTIDASNLRAGIYSVTVTDANGCTAVRTNIEVKVKPVDPVVTAPKFSTATVSSNYTGFGVSCFGGNNGSISAKLSEGTYPITVTLKSGSQTIKSSTINGPDISFTDLVAGAYTIEATNSKGTVISSIVTVTQPSKLAAANPTVKCTEKNKDNGSIEINMNNTGAGNYGYAWFGLSALGNKVENLDKGVYNVTVTDANGCQLRITNIDVKECVIKGDCYTATTVITPNGDSFNDIFIINCADNAPGDLSVFDRWGRLVYSQSNYDNTWQGVDNSGKALKEGGYIWVLTVNFGQGRKEIYKGTLTLLLNN
jgi:gliding motility-associated-like protein